MDNSLFTEEEWEYIQKILDENERALERFYEMYKKITGKDRE